MRDDFNPKTLKGGPKSSAFGRGKGVWYGSKPIVVSVTLLLTLLLGGTVLAAFRSDALSSLAYLFARPSPLQWEGPSLAEQVAVSDGVTIRLINVVASFSHTVVELVIEDPQISPDRDNPVDFLIRDDNLELTGFAHGRITRQHHQIRPGATHVVLELAPLTDFDATASIELVNLCREQPATGVVGSGDILAGPWRFEFTPSVRSEERFEVRFPVDEEVAREGIKIVLEEVQLSSTETIIHYRIEGTPRIREGIGAPKLYYADQVVEGQSKSNTDGDSLLVSFPAVPRDIKEFKVVFGPFFSCTGDRASLVVELPPLDHIDLTGLTEPMTFELDQLVPVGATVFRFTSLIIGDCGFRLVYEPANGNNERFVLAGPGSIVSARDDLGNIYPSEGQGTRLDLRDGTILMWQNLEFSGTLSGKATRLTIESDGTGVIGEAPFEFLVNIPD